MYRAGVWRVCKLTFFVFHWYVWNAIVSVEVPRDQDSHANSRISVKRVLLSPLERLVLSPARRSTFSFSVQGSNFPFFESKQLFRDRNEKVRPLRKLGSPQSSLWIAWSRKIILRGPNYEFGKGTTSRAVEIWKPQHSSDGLSENLSGTSRNCTVKQFRYFTVDLLCGKLIKCSRYLLLSAFV